MNAVLSIGTSHPLNIAGIGLDIMLGARAQTEVFTIVAAVSAQDAHGVHALHAVDLTTMRRQAECVPWPRIGAIRIGALPSAAHVALIAELVAAHPRPSAVVDPVLVASAGGALGAADVADALRDRLLTLGNVITTPNLGEAARLLRRETIARAEMESAARELLTLGCCAVVLTGGHLDGEPCDVLVERARTRVRAESFSATRLPGDHRGTGCTLAFGIAEALAHGAPIRDALQAGRALVRERIIGNG